MRPFRQTRIICTLGPATDSHEILKQLYQAGMNVARLNMSHASHADAARMITWLKTLNRKVSYPVAVLLDTQGPEIRTGERNVDLNLKTGAVVNVTVRGNVDVEESSIQVNYGDLVNTVAVGDRITVDNGLINLRVLGKKGVVLTCAVIDGGVLGSKKHVNLPGVHINLPSITEKDKEDIAFGIEHEVDFIALSFVRQAEDVLELRRILGEKAGKIRVIAKIEDAEGVANVESIVRVSDGIMVARGDLGVEIDIADLPNQQRRIVRICAELGCRSIVATHLLESMIKNPIPTRAEVTDVANAVYEEVDAVMLSGETSIGKYPVRCVEYVDAIAKASERLPIFDDTKRLKLQSDKQHMAIAAVDLAESMGVKGLVTITRRGFMADYLTNCRPHEVPIFAFTNDSSTRRRLILNRSVFPHRIDFSLDNETTLQRAFRILRSKESLGEGDKVVVISDVISGSGIDSIQTRVL